jgi:hypothetical protein
MGNGDVGALLRERVAQLLDGRPVLVTGGPLAGLGRQVPDLEALTRQPPFLLGIGWGTGPLPPAGTPRHVLETPAQADLMASVRSSLIVLRDLPRAARDAINAWDPQRRALVLAGPFYTPRELAGRPVLDGRLPQWEALEDKSTVDRFWDECGVTRAPAEVVPASYEAACAAARCLDEGAGTVWSGDASRGFNGGAEYVRWVRTAAQARAAADFFAERCEQVRVMPFLEGLPCSIHGIVLADGVVVLRPVEMVTLRPRAGDVDRLRYGGVSTHWDPAVVDRETMRAVARTVGGALRERVGYRGGFSVDGVMTAAGFLPTELNPRFSGGLAAVAKGLPDFPLGLLQAVLVSGHDPGSEATDLEAALLSAADQHRWGGGAAMLSTVRRDETEIRHVVVSGTTVRCADEDERPDGELMLGPSQTGAYLRFEPRADAIAVGSSLAPLVASAFALADRLWNTGIGPVDPAPQVRTHAVARTL